MSVEEINTTSNISNINNNAQIAPPKRSRLTRHIGFCNNLNDYSEQVETGNKEKADGKALLWGSLAALAIGGGIYLATRGRKSSSNMTSSLSKTSSQTAENTVKEVDSLINPELIKDKNLCNIISEINNKFKIDGNFNPEEVYISFLSPLQAKLYLKNLENILKCKSPEELYKLLTEIDAKQYDIPVTAINYHKKIDLSHLENSYGVKIPANATSQEKIKLFIDAAIDKVKQRIRRNTRTSLKDFEALNDKKNIEYAKSVYDHMIEEFRISYEFITGTKTS